MSEPTASPTNPTAPFRRRRWLPAVLGVLILVFGIGIGACGTLIIARHQIVYRLHHPRETDQWLTNWTARLLRLSPQEKAKVGAVFAKHMAAFAQLRRETYPRVTGQLSAMRDDVAAVLDERKAQKWRAGFDRIRGTWMLPPPAPESGLPRQP